MIAFPIQGSAHVRRSATLRLSVPLDATKALRISLHSSTRRVYSLKSTLRDSHISTAPVYRPRSEGAGMQIRRQSSGDNTQLFPTGGNRDIADAVAIEIGLQRQIATQPEMHGQ